MKALICKVIGGGFLMAALAVSAQTDKQGDLKLPEDIAQNAQASDDVQAPTVEINDNQAAKTNAAGTVLEEFRSGGRLERVTIERDSGIEEVYQNQRNDALWNGTENELGDAKNVRSWKLGSW